MWHGLNATSMLLSSHIWPILLASVEGWRTAMFHVSLVLFLVVWKKWALPVQIDHPPELGASGGGLDGPGPYSKTE